MIRKSHPKLRPLVEAIRAFGYTVTFQRRWDDPWDRAYGAVEIAAKSVWIITTRDGVDRTVGDLAFVLAHELRHIVHYTTGHYPSYYSGSRYMSMEELARVVAVGHRAELDCDKAARAYLKENGLYSTLVHRRYPKSKVAHYTQYNARRLLRKTGNYDYFRDHCREHSVRDSDAAVGSGRLRSVYAELNTAIRDGLGA